MISRNSLDSRLLQVLFQQRDTPSKVDDLARSLNESPSEIRARLDALALIGYPIVEQPHRGLFLGEVSDIWCGDEMTARLADSPLPGGTAWEICLFGKTASTNDLALREGLQGHAEGLVMVAERQTKGRGRQGRLWESPPRGGVYASLLLRPPWPAERLTRLTAIMSVAAAEAVERLSGLEVRIKWPNDLFARGKKLAGILNEAHFEQGRIAFVVAGLGLNVNQSRADFGDEVRQTATSLRIETDREFRRADVLVAVLERVAKRLDEPFDRVREEWTRRCLNLGEALTVGTAQGRLEGQAVGFDDDGALLLRLESGRIQRVTAGDVF